MWSCITKNCKYTRGRYNDVKGIFWNHSLSQKIQMIDKTINHDFFFNISLFVRTIVLMIIKSMKVRGNFQHKICWKIGLNWTSTCFKRWSSKCIFMLALGFQILIFFTKNRDACLKWADFYYMCNLWKFLIDIYMNIQYS